jgi:5-(carboxyamino)imidazole ribonucleotide mutase
VNTHALEGKLLPNSRCRAGSCRHAGHWQSGAANAALLAAAVIALSDAKVAKRLDAWRARQTRAVAKRPKD